MSKLAKTPEPPYYVAIFTSVRTAQEDTAYARMAEVMEKLAAEQPGYLGIESVRSGGDDRVGITVSYWKDEASIAAWRANAEHQVAQQKGRGQWYTEYQLRIARVERAYGYTAD